MYLPWESNSQLGHEYVVCCFALRQSVYRGCWMNLAILAPCAADWKWSEAVEALPEAIRESVSWANTAETPISRGLEREEKVGTAAVIHTYQSSRIAVSQVSFTGAVQKLDRWPDRTPWRKKTGWCKEKPLEAFIGVCAVPLGIYLHSFARKANRDWSFSDWETLCFAKNVFMSRTSINWLCYLLCIKEDSERMHHFHAINL